MSPLVILIALLAGPVVVLMALRINAALVFLSLCLGDVLVQFVANDANAFVSTVSPQHASQTNLILLVGPAVISAIFMIRTVRGSRLLLNVLPALGVGLLTALLVVPLMSPGLAFNILSLPLWQEIKRSQDLIVGLSAVVSLLFLLLQRTKSHKGHHGKKHHA